MRQPDGATHYSEIMGAKWYYCIPSKLGGDYDLYSTSLGKARVMFGALPLNLHPLPHPHADSMALYAEDAKVSTHPWEGWEVRYTDERDSWDTINSHPLWSKDALYRRKQHTININGIEVPKPESVAPEDGTPYYIPDFYFGEYIYITDFSFSKEHLDRGLMHLTKEAAIAHAKALLSFTKKEK